MWLIGFLVHLVKKKSVNLIYYVPQKRERMSLGPVLGLRSVLKSNEEE